ncbi:MAG: transcription-repair coupling factor, partial [Pseudomonadota bacterium]
MAQAADVLDQLGNELQAGVPEGLDAVVIAQLVTEASARLKAPGLHLHVVRDDRRLVELENALKFFAPDLRVIAFPAWDTVPYDRIGPTSDIVAKRITALSKLVLSNRKQPTLVLATINAVLQKVPPRAYIRSSMKQMAVGQRIDLNRLTKRLSLAGFTRTGTVMEP